MPAQADKRRAGRSGPGQAQTKQEADGRRQRSERSRAKIVEAMFAVIRSGDMNPSAAALAEHANVGIRTVFRHFDDVEGLYREMTAQMEAEILPLMTAHFQAETWQGRLDELITRRVDIYERVMPVKIAAGLKRFQSSYLMEDYQAFLTHEREGLKAVLPVSVSNDATLFAALEMVTAFNAWRRLRQDQKLSRRKAENVMRDAVKRLIGDLA